MRQFDGIIFYGSEGCQDDEKRLFSIINTTLQIISGLQQPPHPDSDEAWERACEDYYRGAKNVEDAVRDVAMALTGQKIKFVGKKQSTRWKKSLKMARGRD